MIGSVSIGMMLTRDLLPVFLDVLEELDTEGDFTELIVRGKCMPDLDSENATIFLNEDLWDALNVLAPPYTYFGSHIGDGADFGFWIDRDGIEMAIYDGDILKVNDLSDIPLEYSGAVLDVNDHGNTTLYEATNGELKEVWAVV